MMYLPLTRGRVYVFANPGKKPGRAREPRYWGTKTIMGVRVIWIGPIVLIIGRKDQ